jgi:hypothetical protein
MMNKGEGCGREGFKKYPGQR